MAEKKWESSGLVNHSGIIFTGKGALGGLVVFLPEHGRPSAVVLYDSAIANLEGKKVLAQLCISPISDRCRRENIPPPGIDVKEGIYAQIINSEIDF